MAQPLQWSGDIRYRAVRSKERSDDERILQQLRARLGLRAEVNENMQAVVRLATATSGISANQTLGDSADPGMARRPFGIDLAYIEAKVFSERGSLWIGRAANPFWAPAKVQTIFDSDLAFEGAAFKWEQKWSRSFAFANLGGFIISENYTAPEDNVDTGLVGGDAGYGLKDANWSWITHLGNYYFLNVQNHLISRAGKDAKIDSYSVNPNERFRGNTVYVNDPLLPAAQRKYFYKRQFVLLELGTEWKQKISGIEYTLYAEAVRNGASSKEGNAYEVGIALNFGKLTVGYARIRKEADSVLGAFSDSDANGGGTGNDGGRALVNFSLGKNASLQVTQFNAQRGIDVLKRDFSMTHVDFLAAF